MIKWKLKTASVNPDQNPNLEKKKKNEGVISTVPGYWDVQKTREYGFLHVVVFQRIFAVCCGL